MAELLVLLLVLACAGLVIAWPILDREPAVPWDHDAELEALEVRHRLALEALRDVEADRRAGALDEPAYRSEREEAEAHAVETRRALDAAATLRPDSAAPATGSPRRRSRWIAAILGGALAVLLLVGWALPAPWGIAEKDARIERIRQLTEIVAANPRDTAALAELSDQYLAGGSGEDVAAALASLILLRDAEPSSRDANQRLVTLLIRAGLWDRAADAADVYAQVVGERDPDIPFLRGLIARGRGDVDAARTQFERFLEIAPDDDRAPMVEGLLAHGSPAPSPSG
jgi:tetratricopeptide (TPR) repeat protein